MKKSPITEYSDKSYKLQDFDAYHSFNFLDLAWSLFPTGDRLDWTPSVINSRTTSYKSIKAEAQSELLRPLTCSLGGCTPSYILHTHAFGTYLLGGIYLAKRIIRWWYFTCKEPEYIIGDSILHVNMFHFLNILYITCTFFYKIYLQWIYSTLFVITRCFSNFRQCAPPLELVGHPMGGEGGDSPCG